MGGRHHDAKSRSYCVAVGSTKNYQLRTLKLMRGNYTMVQNHIHNEWKLIWPCRPQKHLTMGCFGWLFGSASWRPMSGSLQMLLGTWLVIATSGGRNDPSPVKRSSHFSEWVSDALVGGNTVAFQVLCLMFWCRYGNTGRHKSRHMVGRFPSWLHDHRHVCNINPGT